MLFSDPVFFLFFAVYFAVHLVTAEVYRDLLIIVGSTIFYAYWNPFYVWLPFFYIAVAHFGAIRIEAAAAGSQERRFRLIVSLLLLFVPLAIFKYTNFFWNDVVGLFISTEGRLVDLALPLGISFVTFTATAYLVDTYQGRFAAEHKPREVAAYLLFFPHLIAGPILRPRELIPQLNAPRDARRGRWLLGAAIFTVGLVKKLVFADQIAATVDAVYGAAAPSAVDALIALYGFSVQIFCDFSGYTDMAIGLAILLRIRLPNNFHRPYAATSLADFWHRWHVTLSRWLRDYLYIPLGGNRRGFPRQIAAILITMVLGGLWHGANWTFVIWGFIHGVGIALSHVAQRAGALAWTRAVPRWVKIVVVFHIVTLAWVYFRAPDVATANGLLATLAFGSWAGAADALTGHAYPLVLTAVFYLLHGIDGHARVRFALARMPRAVVWAALGLMWVLAITISAGSSAKFIYFDF